MKWKQWKLGAVVSVVLAALCAGASWKTGMHWTDLIPVFCVACATHFGAYLKDHPTDQISFDTTTITKPPESQTPKQ